MYQSLVWLIVSVKKKYKCSVYRKTLISLAKTNVTYRN